MNHTVFIRKWLTNERVRLLFDGERYEWDCFWDTTQITQKQLLVPPIGLAQSL